MASKKDTFNKSTRRRPEVILGRALLNLFPKAARTRPREGKRMLEKKKAEILDMIANGADLTITDARGVTVLMYACLYGHTEIAIALIKAGADVNIKDQSNTTPLMRACYFTHEKALIHALLDADADVTVKDSAGHDAYYYASEHFGADILSRIKKIQQHQEWKNVQGKPPQP